MMHSISTDLAQGQELPGGTAAVSPCGSWPVKQLLPKLNLATMVLASEARLNRSLIKLMSSS